MEEQRGAEFRDLIDLAIQGDAAARDEIFSRVAAADGDGPLLAIARRLLPAGDRARDLLESKDLVQTALRQGWLDLADFRGETFAQFLAWMRTILRHKLHRSLRKNQPRVTDEGLDLAELPAAVADNSGPAARLVEKETRSRVRDAMAELPEDQRLVLELRLRGVRSVDIAEQLEVSPELVRQREYRAIRRLRRALESDSEVPRAE